MYPQILAYAYLGTNPKHVSKHVSMYPCIQTCIHVSMYPNIQTPMGDRTKNADTGEHLQPNFRKLTCVSASRTSCNPVAKL